MRTGNRLQQAEAIRLLTAAYPASSRGCGIADAARGSRGTPAIQTRRLPFTSQRCARIRMPWSPWSNLGRLYGSRGLLDEAIKLWREALKRNPSVRPKPVQTCRLLWALKARSKQRKRVRRSQGFCSFE